MGVLIDFGEWEDPTPEQLELFDEPGRERRLVPTPPPFTPRPRPIETPTMTGDLL